MSRREDPPPSQQQGHQQDRPQARQPRNVRVAGPDGAQAEDRDETAEQDVEPDEGRAATSERRSQRDRRVKAVGNGSTGSGSRAGNVEPPVSPANRSGRDDVEPPESDVDLPWPRSRPPAGAGEPAEAGPGRRGSAPASVGQPSAPARSRPARSAPARSEPARSEPGRRQRRASVVTPPDRRRQPERDAHDLPVANRTETIDERLPGRRLLRTRVGEAPPRVDRAVFREPSGRRSSAGRAIAVGLLCFGIWTLFDANQLYHNALTSPFGTRRSVSVAFLRPIAAVANALGLSGPVNAANSALGRNQATTNAKLPPPPFVPPSGNRPPNNVTISGVSPRPHTHLGQAVGSSTGVQHYTWPPPVTQPTPSHPLVMLDIGDSIGEDLGFGLLDQFAQDRYVHVIPKGKIDTGLARPDVWNWPVALENDLRQYHPGVVVIMMGANDNQSLLLANGNGVPTGTAQWDRLYRQRVALLMAEATAAGAHVMWVGLPPLSSPAVNSTFAAHVNAIAQQEAAVHNGVTYVSSWSTLGGPHGSFVQYKRVGGNVLEIRYSDGVHLAPSGYDLLASSLVQPMERAWRIDLHTKPLLGG